MWFTGLSGSGKSTIAMGISKILLESGYSIKILDGDEIRSSIHTQLGFSPKDIIINNNRIAVMSNNLLQNYNIIIVPIISPFKSSRLNARKVIGRSFIEVYIKSSLATVIKRDVKGLYNKAQKGNIEHFIGIDPIVPYEPPEHPDIVLNTEMETVKESIRKLYSFLENNYLVEDK